jgi:hypothetical protein
MFCDDDTRYTKLTPRGKVSIASADLKVRLLKIILKNIATMEHDLIQGTLIEGEEGSVRLTSSFKVAWLVKSK